LKAFFDVWKYFFEILVLLGVKEFHDLKIIWKRLTPGRYPVHKNNLKNGVKNFFFKKSKLTSLALNGVKCFSWIFPLCISSLMIYKIISVNSGVIFLFPPRRKRLHHPTVIRHLLFFSKFLKKFQKFRSKMLFIYFCLNEEWKYKIRIFCTACLRLKFTCNMTPRPSTDKKPKACILIWDIRYSSIRLIGQYSQLGWLINNYFLANFYKKNLANRFSKFFFFTRI